MVQESLKESLKKEKKLKDDLAAFLVADLEARARQSPSKGALLLRQDEAISDLLSIAQKLKASPNQPLQKHLFVLASANASGSSPFVILGEPDKANKAMEQLKADFGSKLKGGGGKGLLQGKLETKLGARDLALLEALV